MIFAFIATSHAKFLATTLDDNVNKTRREKFVVANAYCLIIEIFIMRCELALRRSIDSIVELIQLLFFSWSISAESTFSVWNNMIVSNSNTMLLHVALTLSKRRRYNCILIDFLLILSNVNFLSSFSSWKSLYSLKTSCDFLFKMFCFEFLLQSRSDLILKMYWYFNFLCFAMKIKWFESLFSSDFSMTWMKIHFAKKFWQIAQTFLVVSIFWICRYCYESSRIWNDWRLSLKMSTKSNDRNQNSLYWNDLHSQFCFEIFNFFKLEFVF